MELSQFTNCKPIVYTFVSKIDYPRKMLVKILYKV